MEVIEYPEDYKVAARVINHKGTPTVLFPSNKALNFAHALKKNPGWYAAPYSKTIRKLMLAEGIDVPPLIESYHFPGPIKPYEHQRRTAATLVEEDFAWCLDDPRTGKTYSCCWALQRLISTGDAKRIFILAPKSIVHSTWFSTLMRVMPMVKVAVGDCSVPEFKALVKDTSNQIIVANHDKIKYALQELRAGNFDTVVVDEINMFRHDTAQRSRALRVLLKLRDKRSWFLTGTPTSGTPDTLYHLVKLINPVVLAGVSFSRWRDMTMQPVPLGTDVIKWKQKPGKEDLISRVLQPCTRAVRSECFDVPPVVYQSHECSLLPAQNKAFKKIKKDRLLYMEDQTVTAVNAGVLQSKLLQIAAGAVYDENGDAIIFKDVIKERAEFCMEQFRQTGKKVIVLSPFSHVLEAVHAELERKTKCKQLLLNGAVGNRSHIEPTFQTDPTVNYLCADPETVQHGFTLSAADTVVWLSPPYKNEVWTQANDRPFAALSKDKLCISIVMVSSTPLEKAIYSQRRSEGARQTEELQLIAELEKFFN